MIRNGWTRKLAQLEKENRQLRAVATNLVGDIAGLKGREGEDLERAIRSGNSWSSVLRARKLLGKDKV